MMGREVIDIHPRQLRTSIKSFVWFLMTGLLQMLRRSLTDCFTFIEDCWREHPEHEFDPNVPLFPVLLKETEIRQVIS